MTARIYELKTPPLAVSNWMEKTHPEKDFTFDYYWYKLSTGEKCYGCLVRKSGKIWSLPQGTITDFLQTPLIVHA